MNFLSTNLCLSCECPPNQSIHWSRSVLPPPTSWQLQRVLHSSWMNRSIRGIWNSAYFNINVLPIDGEWVLPRMRLITRSYLIPLRLDSALGGEVPSVVDILQFPEYTSARQYIHGNGNNFYLGRSNNFCCQLLHSTNSLGNTLFHSLSIFAQTHCWWSHSAISYFLHMPLFISTCRRVTHVIRTFRSVQFPTSTWLYLSSVHSIAVLVWAYNVG